MPLIAIKKYKHDVSDDIGRMSWEIMVTHLNRRGIHCTVLPDNAPRPRVQVADLHPIDYYRIGPDGTKYYDWVLYGNSHIKRGYVLELGNAAPMPPLPDDASPGKLSRTARALVLVDDGATHQVAADTVGISRAAVTMACTRRAKLSGVARAVRLRSSWAARAASAGASTSASAQAVAFLLANPDHTHEQVAFLFGLTRAAVSMALKRYRAGRGHGH